jgi:phenylacetate-CoA ligase
MTPPGAETGEATLPAGLDGWSAERIEARQLALARETVDYARERSGYYRRAWAEAGVGKDLDSLADLERFPIVTKAELIAAGEDWLRSGEGHVGFSTRGTSGEPLVLWLGDDEAEAFARPAARGFWRAGLRPGMTALLMSPVWHKLAACEGRATVGLGARATYFWGSSMGTAHVDAFLETARRNRPQLVSATVPFALAVVRRCRQRGIEPGELLGGVRSAVLVGLPMTPELRLHLRDSLGVGDVFERSGTQEGAALDECAAHTAPHVHADVCRLEVVDAAGRTLPPGKRGGLVVTKLHAGGSPFVRYSTGDVAELIPGACPCGSSLPRLKIYGRPEGSVNLAGRLITGYDVRCCIDADPELVGRLALLVRGTGGDGDTLTVAIEGEAMAEGSLAARLRERLGVGKVAIHWLGETQLAWGFRQAIDASELTAAAGRDDAR